MQDSKLTMMKAYNFATLVKIEAWFYFVLLLTISIPFSYNADKLAIIIFSVTALLTFIFSKQSCSYKTTVILSCIPPVAYFLNLVIGALYSKDTSLALSKIETSLPLILLPLGLAVLMAFHNLSGKISKILKAFVVSNLFALFYALFSLTLNSSTNVRDSINFFDLYSRDNLAEQLNIHPIYIALFHALNLQVLFYLLLVEKNQKKTTVAFWLFCLLASFFFIILLGAKMALIAAIITTLIWIVYYIVSLKNIIVGLISVILFFITVTASLQYVPNINKRFLEIESTKLAPPQGLSHNSTNLRIGQLYCSIEAIQNHFLFGAGTGDYQIELNNCYMSRGYSDVLYLDNYNSHNQYIQTWLMIGIPGLLLLITSLMLPIFAAFKNKDILSITIFITFIFCFLTESILLTTKGVIAFSFFYMLFMLRLNESTTVKI